MKKFLEVGDIIQLEKGMTVYASIPEKFLLKNAPFSEERLEAAVEIGKVYRKAVPDKERIVGRLCVDLYKTLRGVDLKHKTVENFVDSLGLNFSPEEFDSSVFAGVYRVYYGGWKSNFSPVPPYTGWHVCCEKVDDPKIRVRFYQNEGFDATIFDIKPIGHEE